jgi:hypothetical protein
LADLRERGFITDDEFQTEKQKVLASGATDSTTVQAD